MTNNPRLVLVGRFGAPQGVRGEIRIKSYTADPLAIGDYGPLSDETGAKKFEIERLRPLKEDMVVAKVKGLSDRDAAGALTGVSLFVAREKLPPPDEDEFYIADLVGLSAVTPDGETIGIVKNVLNFGAGDILEIAPASGETLMLPFTKEIAPSIDFSGGKIVVVRPAETE
ncbi:MAG: ribosome maturation factor RimM [Methylobacteriaceae bacterium]|nr:ribosome maturation factor RimM [Methylobacteriaceae bacterium]MCO5088741.1 ribosome maturation factor RimM [Methylobacteriaceae bacterium]